MSKNKINITFDINSQEIQDDIQRQIRSRAESCMKTQLDEYFREGFKFYGDGSYSKKNGPGYDLTLMHIEDFLMGPKFNEKIEALINDCLPKLLDEAIIEATTRAARKLAYTLTEDAAKQALLTLE